MYPGTLHVGAMDEMRWMVTCTDSRTDVTPVVASQSWRLFSLVRAPCLLSFPTLTLRVPQDDHLQFNSHSTRVSPFALHPPSTLRYRVIACFFFSFLFSILNQLPSPPPTAHDRVPSWPPMARPPSPSPYESARLPSARLLNWHDATTTHSFWETALSLPSRPQSYTKRASVQ